MTRKLKLILALTQDGASRFTALLQEYGKYFTSNQGAFQGKIQKYTLTDTNYVPDNKDEVVMVTTTVNEKLDYAIKAFTDYVSNVMTKERTNASGVAKSHLFIDGKDWGEFFSNELLCMKGLIDNANLKLMITNIPTRTVQDNWTKSTNDSYSNREVYEKTNPKIPSRTTVKIPYILTDDNIEKLKDQSGYKPQVAIRETLIQFGETERTDFTGAISQVERAAILERLSTIRDAITTALEIANDVEVVSSSMTSQKLFGYLFYGQNN